MKKIFIACAALAAISSSAFAADGEALFKKCAACHGANADKPYLGGKVPALNTLAKDDIVASIKGYKEGTVGDGGKGKYGMAGVMKGQVATLDDESIAALADFIESKK
ncbi:MULTISPECIES: c-type cytochrome [unclassified Campylobacter]|uniref:c-type cytochrome n=1 Tax=unclassified Campylobacter TaxID=2593542 RepID=UPI0022E9E213|nr:MULTISPECIES: c-type cytochrome [unclassified Campylobacter]MDA3053785.1 c-type cytochrome [Campylobacter sp. VBCF_07 NA4]MDA3060326.1 c-type cytochrome [Campylobacter sp. VBCF_02 NA5]MDA3069836.1 c-type cytochrome [Campylobacter sp. VBCF_08 NA3]WBR54837.1 c-type cytochrome [Campylobacter sp. VBCF_01 NA2]